MDARFRFSLLLTILILVSISEVTSIPSKQFLGIDPQDLNYYKSNVIKCKDGSKKFRKELLNDEFCDCPDGTDEPGTSACPEGRFHCQNAGHSPIKIFSSRVNDGICDCCDGSDEYESNAKCSNTCWEAGKVAREKLKKRIEAFKEGVIVRKREVEKASAAYAKDEAELGKLKVDEKAQKEVVQKLKEKKERIDKLEEEERLKKEKEEKKMREEEEKLKKLEKEEVTHHHGALNDHEQDETSFADRVEREKGSDQSMDQDEISITDGVERAKDSDQPMVQHNGEGYEDVLETKHDFSESDEIVSDDFSKQLDYGMPEVLSKEELGRRVASRWTGEGSEQVPDLIQNAENEMSSSHEHKSYTSEVDTFNYDDDDDDGKFEDDHGDGLEDVDAGSMGSDNAEEFEKSDPADSLEARPSWLNKIQHTMQNFLHAFNFFKASVNISDAVHIRKEYGDASAKLSEMQSRISSLTEKLKCDFGEDKEFYLFYDQCFESKQNKYVYKICPFKQSSQDEGYSSTRLGSWDKFDDSYKVMVFSNGDKCWNGPDRSLKVRLRCGSKNEISDVDEPSRCEYAALMSTPAVCLEGKLKELEKKLEQMNTREPQSHHDEF